MKSTSVAVKQEPPRRAPSPVRPPPDGRFTVPHTVFILFWFVTSVLLTAQMSTSLWSLLFLAQIPLSQTSFHISGGLGAPSGRTTVAGKH